MDPIRLDLEMTLDREAFLRRLPAAVEMAGTAEEEGAIVGRDGPRVWRLRLVALPDLQAGSLALPRHRVELRFEGYAPAEAAAFLARFHRAFQRGGG